MTTVPFEGFEEITSELANGEAKTVQVDVCLCAFALSRAGEEWEAQRENLKGIGEDAYVRKVQEIFGCFGVEQLSGFNALRLQEVILKRWEELEKKLKATPLVA